jgi:hypothetical protein
MKSELVPLNGEEPIPITRDVTVVGRREYCDVVIPHASLSKRHCVLVRTDGLLIVRDLISTNGTKVNGQRVMWAALLPNDKLTLGRVKYRVYLGPDTELSPSELGNRSPQEHAVPSAYIDRNGDLGGSRPPQGAGAFAPPAAGVAPQLPMADFAFEADDLDLDDLGVDIIDDEDPLQPYVLEMDQ